MLRPQNPHACRVEGGDPHCARHAAEHLFQTLAHLLRRLIREGDGKDLAGPRSTRRDEIGDTCSEHTRFP